MMQPDADAVRLWTVDTPEGPVTLTNCLHPDSMAERPDIPTSIQCPAHARTVYLCLDESALWCDGMPDADPHELGLSVEGVRALEPLETPSE